MSQRIKYHPLLEDYKDGKNITFIFNSEEYIGIEGDTIASALLVNGIRTLRYHEETGTPHGLYCNIGQCFECRVNVNHQQGVRACITPIEDGMVIKSQDVLPTPVKDWREKHDK
ncbi:(2Fe-2S)-binding protein [Aquisalibacillus elongatus]|uniref:Sarcosine oxidase subunit alpha n=1 Tax=Aquisalibacillus elongatus TaxID=485577 RepID=A0A3N5BYD3_9BACI|nr:(2Fe-2S)-binding protein [Aquisalibacillus elongatus]RPF52182.1 sarcosine oxidase subunit alpha [Aquisalibacillus elongatus]